MESSRTRVDGLLNVRKHRPLKSPESDLFDETSTDFFLETSASATWALPVWRGVSVTDSPTSLGLALGIHRLSLVPSGLLPLPLFFRFVVLV
jgi:hypothetical protein